MDNNIAIQFKNVAVMDTKINGQDVSKEAVYITNMTDPLCKGIRPLFCVCVINNDLNPMRAGAKSYAAACGR